jgi:hypothetical protein
MNVIMLLGAYCVLSVLVSLFVARWLRWCSESEPIE